MDRVDAGPAARRPSANPAESLPGAQLSGILPHVTSTETAVSTSRGPGWWLRSTAMVLVPLAIALVAGRRDNAGIGLVAGLLALIASIYVFHPDTLGWKLSLTPYLSKGPDTGPSRFWQVWARLSGPLLLVVCAVAAVTYTPPPPEQPGCVITDDLGTVCPWMDTWNQLTPEQRGVSTPSTTN